MWTNPDPCMKLITSELLFNCRNMRLTGILFPTLILEHNDQTTLPLCLISFSLFFTGHLPSLTSLFRLPSAIIHYLHNGSFPHCKYVAQDSATFLCFLATCIHKYLYTYIYIYSVQLLTQGIPTSIHLALEPKGDNAQRWAAQRQDLWLNMIPVFLQFYNCVICYSWEDRDVLCTRTSEQTN